MAVAHTLLLLAYQVLSTGKPYQDQQAPALEPQQQLRMIRHHLRRLGKLGVAVGSPRQAPLCAHKSGANGAPKRNGAAKRATKVKAAT